MFISAACEKERRMALKKNTRKYMSKLGILPSFWIDLMWLNLSVGDMSVGRQEAFEIFRRDYYNNPTIEENKHNLKQRYAEAKSLGEGVNKSRQRISKNLRHTVQAYLITNVPSWTRSPQKILFWPPYYQYMWVAWFLCISMCIQNSVCYTCTLINWSYRYSM